jgi:hypothetical protein
MDIIIGGGKYGCDAISFLRQKQKNFIVIDTNPSCLAVTKFKVKHSKNLNDEGEHFFKGDLSTALEFIEQIKPDYVFPTAPVHIAADLARIKFKLKPWTTPINDVLSNLPPIIVLLSGKGKLILSFNRDHDCIDYCAMPSVCPSSGIKKPCTMTELLKFACPEAFILISYSMSPGMGALKGSDLLDFFNWAQQKEKFVVVTTCDCHGVLNAFSRY